MLLMFRRYRKERLWWKDVKYTFSTKLNVVISNDMLTCC